MKKLILAFLFAGTIVAANAQEPKSLLVYGDLNLNTVRDSNLNKDTHWDATFGVGYQFNQHWTLGGNISWGQEAKKDSAGIKNTDNLYRIGPFARYSHYFNRGEIFFWYAQLDFLYQGGYHTHEGDPATNKHTGIYTGIYPGLGINICKGLCINFSVGGLNYATDKSQNANVVYSTNAFNFTFGHTMNIGISKNFNTGHKMHASHEPGDEINHRKLDRLDDEDDAAPKPKRKERNRDEDE